MGVYDNLGLEPAWKSYDTILVSDGGGSTSDEPQPKRDWLEHIYRVLNFINNQVGSLRKRQVVASYQLGLRKGAYWGMRTDMTDYKLPAAMPCPFAQTLALANTATRLKSLDKQMIWDKAANEDSAELIGWIHNAKHLATSISTRVSHFDS